VRSRPPFYVAGRKSHAAKPRGMTQCQATWSRESFRTDSRFLPMRTGATACLTVIESNALDQVTWVHSYVSADKKRTFCLYDGPSPEAIRRAAVRNKLPVKRVT
jgi:hypothetical protein